MSEWCRDVLRIGVFLLASVNLVRTWVYKSIRWETLVAEALSSLVSHVDTFRGICLSVAPNWSYNIHTFLHYFACKPRPLRRDVQLHSRKWYTGTSLKTWKNKRTEEPESFYCYPKSNENIYLPVGCGFISKSCCTCH